MINYLFGQFEPRDQRVLKPLVHIYDVDDWLDLPHPCSKSVISGLI